MLSGRMFPSAWKGGPQGCEEEQMAEGHNELDYLVLEIFCIKSAELVGNVSEAVSLCL